MSSEVKLVEYADRQMNSWIVDISISTTFLKIDKKM